MTYNPSNPGKDHLVALGIKDYEHYKKEEKEIVKLIRKQVLEKSENISDKKAMDSLYTCKNKNDKHALLFAGAYDRDKLTKACNWIYQNR